MTAEFPGEDISGAVVTRFVQTGLDVEPTLTTRRGLPTFRGRKRA